MRLQIHWAGWSEFDYERKNYCKLYSLCSAGVRRIIDRGRQVQRTLLFAEARSTFFEKPFGKLI